MIKKYCDACGIEIIEEPLEQINPTDKYFYGKIEYYNLLLCDVCKKQLSIQILDVYKKYHPNIRLTNTYYDYTEDIPQFLDK